MALNKPDSARIYLELYKNYTDSLILKKKTEYVSKLKIIYETDKLLNNIKKQQVEIRASRNKIINLAVLLVISSIALAVFFIFYKKLQKSYKNIVKESVRLIKIEEEFKNCKNKPDKIQENK